MSRSSIQPGGARIQTLTFPKSESTDRRLARICRSESCMTPKLDYRTQTRSRGCCGCAASPDRLDRAAAARHTHRQGCETVPYREKTNSQQRLRHPGTRALLSNRVGRRPAESDRSTRKSADARRGLPERADAPCGPSPRRFQSGLWSIA